MEDVSAAWAASGIFATSSNGNNAPGCKTSSSPGSRVINYSTGAYDINNDIADFSSRGAGQDGETKPNISAPGVDVRSAFPGGGYASRSGTSMAAPHTAGAVALLWSAAPVLVGDVDSTRELLNGSALDSPDDECGGTSEDNNVFGEGRLDASALLDAAPVGDTGILAVAVTDASTRDPVANATVVISGPVDRERVTGADGAYSLPLPAGNYTVTASAFGYAEKTASVTITTGETTTAGLALDPLPRATVRGQVTDGSGHGWPLYAKITVDGVPQSGGTFYTKPANGRFSFSLPATAMYTLTVEPQYGGYETVTTELVVGEDNVTHDIDIPVADSCTAAGYQYAYDGLSADFDDGQPEGWTVLDNIGTGNEWRFDDPFNRGNRTGGAGGFAVAQSPGGVGGAVDTTLVTPVIDLTGHEAPIIRFRQDFIRLLTDVADVDVSIDGGATWQNVLRQTSNVRGPIEELLPIPLAADEPDVRVRFHYFDGVFNSRWWQIDDAFVGTRTCAPLRGGLVLGHVHDRNTGEALNGATVTSNDNAQENARSMATPDDPGLADGFYWMFSSLTGSHRFIATTDSYSSHTRKVSVEASRATEQDFQLPAGQLVVEPDEITASPRLGERRSGHSPLPT